MKNYTTVEEMTDKVNELLGLLEKARDLALDLEKRNRRNGYALTSNDKEIYSEKRPISIIERMNEADRYAKFFEQFGLKIKDLSHEIGMNY